MSDIAKNHGKEHSTNLRVSKGLCALTLAIGLSLSSYAFAAGTSVPFGEKDDRGNILASADYDKQGNLIIGNKGTVAQGEKKAGKNNTAIGTNTDTLRNVTKGDAKENGQTMDAANTRLVDGEVSRSTTTRNPTIRTISILSHSISLRIIPLPLVRKSPLMAVMP